MPNYNYVVDSSFKPFSFDEILKAVSLYNSAYTNVENQFQQIADNTATLEYLKKEAEENPDSDAGKIYQKYAADMNKAFSDFTRNGLSQANRRDLLDLKRRYTSEIGLLQEANKALQKERERRLALSEKDPSMLYAVNNLKTDNFLHNRTPNMYQISGEDLRKEGAQYAANLSARMYTNPKISDINKYYQAIISTQGYNPQLINNWRNDLESIPEFNQAVNDILTARGVKGNLTGIDYERARQSVINGIMEGAAYKENMDIKQNEGVLTRAQAASINLQKEGQRLQAAREGLIKDANSPTGYRYDVNHDLRFSGNLWMYDVKDGKIVGVKPKYQNNYKIDPNTGKPKEIEEPKSTNPLYKLKGAEALNNEGDGFSYLEGNTRHRLKYVGAVSRHTGRGKTWRSGNIGDDLDNHLWGMTSSNVVSTWGNYTASGLNDNSHVITEDEAEKLMYKNSNGEIVATDFGKEVEEYVKKYMEDNKLLEVPRVNLVEVPGNYGKSYLIAIEE